jgi:hypothetical protein
VGRRSSRRQGARGGGIQRDERHRRLRSATLNGAPDVRWYRMASVDYTRMASARSRPRGAAGPTRAQCPRARPTALRVVLLRLAAVAVGAGFEGGRSIPSGAPGGGPIRSRPCPPPRWWSWRRWEGR